MSEPDVIDILMQQHSRIRDMFTLVKTARGIHKSQEFDELRAVLAAHETAEEMIIRPVSMRSAAPGVADARNHEEREANKLLANLEKMDVRSAEFKAHFADLEQAVITHAEREEKEEFPAVRAARNKGQLRSMGKTLQMAQRIAPTHPHPLLAGSPMAQWTLGPVASIVDRVKDVITRP